MNKKILVTTRGQLEFFKLALTAEEFYSKYELSMDLVRQLLARKLSGSILNTDRALTPDEMAKEGFSN